MRVLLFAVVFLVSTPAFAANVNMNVPLSDSDGKTAQDCDHVNFSNPQAPVCDRVVELTLGRLVAAALDQVESGLKPEEIVTRGTLVQKIRKAMADVKAGQVTPVPIDLSTSDVDLIKAQLAKMKIPPSQIAQAYGLLKP